MDEVLTERAERMPLRHADVERRHMELRNLVAGLRPDERALVANADLARRMVGFDGPLPERAFEGAQPAGF